MKTPKPGDIVKVEAGDHYTKRDVEYANFIQVSKENPYPYRLVTVGRFIAEINGKWIIEGQYPIYPDGYLGEHSHTIHTILKDAIISVEIYGHDDFELPE